MKVVVQNLPKNTVTLSITLLPEEIKISEEKVWNDVAKNAEIDGFRKGNAPLNLVKQKANPKKVENEIVTDLIKEFYPRAVEQEKIMPVIAPKIDFDSFDLDKDFTFSATTATHPEIKIGDYKKTIKDLYDKKNEEFKQAQEGKQENKDEKQEEKPDHVHLTPNEVIDAVASVTTAEISDLLIEEEANKMLSRLVNQLQTLKLDMDNYLKSQNKSAEDIKAEYAQIAQKNITAELAMIEVVKLEKVEATDEELNQTLEATGDSKLKDLYNKDEFQKAYIKSIIAKNKVIWKLSSPDEKEHKHE